MPLPKTCTTHYNTQLGLPEKGRTFKGLVICYVVWSGIGIYGIGFSTNERCVGLVPCCGQDGYQAQVQQHPIDKYRFNKIQKGKER